jgi:hypothetical protein
MSVNTFDLFRLDSSARMLTSCQILSFRGLLSLQAGPTSEQCVVRFGMKMPNF